MLNIHCHSNKSFSKLIFGIIYLSFIAILVDSCNAPQEPKIDNPSDPLSTNPIPLPPINITIQSISKSSYQLSWQGQSSFETGYLIERFPGRRGAEIPDTIYTTRQTLIEEEINSSIFYYQIHAMAQSRVGPSSTKIKVIYSEGRIDSLPGNDVDNVIFDPKGNYLIKCFRSDLYIQPFSHYKLINRTNDFIEIGNWCSCSISPEGDLLAITTSTELQILKTLDHSYHYRLSGYSPEIWIPNKGIFPSVPIFSPDGKSIAFIDNETDIEICNVETRFVTKVISLSPIKINLMIFSPDGQFLITGCSDNKIRYFHAGQNYSLIKSFSCPQFGINLAISSDGLILAGNFNSTLMFWHITDTTISSTIYLSETTNDMYFIPGTHKLTVGNGGYYAHGIFIIDADNAIIDRTIMIPSINFRSYTLSPNGKYFVLAGIPALTQGWIYFWSAGDLWWIIPF